MNWKRYRFVYLMAKRDIVDDKKISFVVIAMLSFSFLNLTFFPAFVQGLSGTFTSNIIETQTGHVLVQAEKGRLDNPDALERKISSLQNVREVEKRLEFTSRLSYQNKQITAQTIGTSEPGSEVYTSRMAGGEMLGSEDDRKLVMGDSLIEGDAESFSIGTLDIQVGRKLRISSDNSSKSMKLKGRIGRPGPGTVVRQVFTTYQTAEELTGAEGQADSIKVLLEDREKADEFKNQLQKLNVGAEIQTWREVSEIASNINSTFAIVTGVVSIVGMIVAVTSVGVVIFINTSKRVRETGIARSFGAEKSEIMMVFVLEALIFGILGIVIGNALMLGIHYLLNASPLNTPIGQLSTVLSQNLLITRSLWMLIAALTAGVIPAYLVSRRGIVETIEQR